MLFDCGIGFNVGSSSDEDQPEISMGCLPALDVAAAEEGFDDVCGFGIGGDEFGAFFAVDDEGFVEAG
jgi:hypothetical protein